MRVCSLLCAQNLFLAGAYQGEKPDHDKGSDDWRENINRIVDIREADNDIREKEFDDSAEKRTDK